MEHLPREILLNEVFMKLSPKDLLNACVANKKFDYVCKDDRLWLQLLQRDFSSDFSDFIDLNLSNKDLYKLLYGLQLILDFLHEKIKNKTLHEATLYDLYHLKKLDLGPNYLEYNQLTSIPKELGLLQNLQELNLEHNQLKSIPHEVGNLTNLRQLDLSFNQLTSIPKELGNLQNLQQLYLFKNQLTTIPKELGALKSLQVLYLYDKRTSIPKEILNLQPRLIIFK